MSEIDVKKSFTKPIIDQLNRDTREDVQKQEGQILILDNAKTFKEVVEASTGRTVSSSILAGALALGQQRAKGFQDKFRRSKKGRRRYNNFIKRLAEGNIKVSATLVPGQNMFLVQSFDSSIKTIKNDMVDYIFNALGIDDKGQKADSNYKIQKGHGESGFAVSQVQLARGFARAEKLAGGSELLKSNFDAFLIGANIDEETRAAYLNQVEDLSVQYKNVVTKSGKLKAQYFSIITYQSEGDNAADGVIEKRLITLFRKYVNSTYGAALIDMKGSSTIRQKVASHVVHSLTDNLKKRSNVKVRLDPNLARLGELSSGVVTETAKKAKKTSIRKKKAGTIKGQRKTRAKKGFDPLSLIVAINKELPATVLGNMNPPALQNRTGNFASSVKVTDIVQTPQGFPSIGYTYDNDPYGVFEMGTGAPPWATPDRDPRKIIDQSIREVAAKLVTGRFYTRRV